MRYDFVDFWGREDTRKVFVTKLLATNSGQCQSLPQLYLILAEELGTTAYLAFSPEHSYIKFQDVLPKMLILTTDLIIVFLIKQLYAYVTKPIAIPKIIH